MAEFLWSLIQLMRDAVAESWDIVLLFAIIFVLGWLYRMIVRGMRIL